MGKGKNGEIVACIIGVVLCYHSKGSGSVMARRHNYKGADRRCQENFHISIIIVIDCTIISVFS
jgi:hypothetical protein